jgi:hypothetical protein
LEKCTAKMAVMGFVTMIRPFEWGSIRRTDSERWDRQPGEKRVLYPLQIAPQKVDETTDVFTEGCSVKGRKYVDVRRRYRAVR